jgi:hypothetical protein
MLNVVVRIVTGRILHVNAQLLLCSEKPTQLEVGMEKNNNDTTGAYYVPRYIRIVSAKCALTIRIYCTRY